ncbi:flagellar hook-associated protein FlgK [Paenibacillus harenae]|uniref:flagellar hook-associated protein FlgK n=1 Tax=Paenibacillus harenae TaxID=306543 RepID=UPI000403BE38|nr:flagellar hook-associated protein FlgK [Paenibacillus harenae]
MRSTFHGIETAKRSLFANQATINTIGHNISNANTPGYSRQRVNLVASRPIEAPGFMRSNTPGQLGTGVEFTSITRIREQYLDDQFRNANSSYGGWSIQSSTLGKLETIFNEPSDSGLRTVLDNFWKSWTDLSKDPENITGRKIVRENALALVDAFNTTSKHLEDLDKDLTANIEVKVSEVNSIAGSIANLNYEIKRLEDLGDNPNDLRDQRDYLVDQLSHIANTTVTHTANGYDISIGTQNIVTGPNAIPATSAQIEAQFTAGRLNGGELSGMILSRDKYVADYKEQIDAMANTLVNGQITVTLPAGTMYNGAKLAADQQVTVNGINGLHKLGYLFTNPPQQAGDVFVPASYKVNGVMVPVTAGNISLSKEITDDPMMIATSMRTEIVNGVNETVKGNNTLANLMADLKNNSFAFTPTSSGNGISSGTIDSYYQSVIGQLGVQAQEAERQYMNQYDIVNQVESSRQSVMGVSLDEEMSELIKFQHAYSAAARFMTSIDETLDKVINGMGIVGR